MKMPTFSALLEAHPDHRFTEQLSPVSVRLTCTAPHCFWSRSFTRAQNAMARASKQRSAMIHHLRDIHKAALETEANHAD